MKKNLFEMGANWEDTWSSDNKGITSSVSAVVRKRPEQHLLSCTREKRRGKIVTVIQPFFLENNTLKVLLKELKKDLGTGGTIKTDTLELQGDVASPLQSILEKKGYRFKTRC